MVELVDTKDLKSFDHCGRAGSSPAPGTTIALILFQGFFFILPGMGVIGLHGHTAAHCGRAGSSPAPGTIKALKLFQGFFFILPGMGVIGLHGHTAAHCGRAGSSPAPVPQ
jgi:hypothetical protein